MKKERPVTARRQRGLAMVETTIVLPLLLLLAMASAEFGHMLNIHNVINKQQQDGARYLSARATYGTTGVVVLDAATVDEARNLVVYGNTLGTGTPLLAGFTIEQVTVSVPSPRHIRVAVEYDYRPIFGRVFSMFGYGENLTIDFPLRGSVVIPVVG